MKAQGRHSAPWRMPSLMRCHAKARRPNRNSSEGMRRCQDAHVPHDEWLRTPRKRKLGRSTSHFSVTSVLFLRADHVLVTAGAHPKPHSSPAMRSHIYIQRRAAQSSGIQHLWRLCPEAKIGGPWLALCEHMHSRLRGRVRCRRGGRRGQILGCAQIWRAGRIPGCRQAGAQPRPPPLAALMHDIAHSLTLPLCTVPLCFKVTPRLDFGTTPTTMHYV